VKKILKLKNFAEIHFFERLSQFLAHMPTTRVCSLLL